jgi:hypothetical protein
LKTFGEPRPFALTKSTAIDQQILRCAGGAAQREAHGDAPADGNPWRFEPRPFDGDSGRLAEPEEPKRAGIATLDGAAQRVRDERAPLDGCPVEPRWAPHGVRCLAISRSSAASSPRWARSSRLIVDSPAGVP